MPTSVQIVKTKFPNVEYVKNAERGVSVQVRREDTQGARARDHADCVFARACVRELHAEGALVSVGVVYVIKGDTAIRYHTPQALSRELVSFDRGAGFSVGEYLLNAAPERAARGTRKKRVRKQGRLAQNRPPVHMTSGIRLKLQDLA
jgi:hypothetical protein